MDWGRFEAFEKVVGIDPGGFETGVAFFERGILKWTTTLVETEKRSHERRHKLYGRLYPTIKSADLLICEEPFLRGTANINMQRMLGVFEYMTNMNVAFINPMTVKLFMGGGRLEKPQVATGALQFLSTEEEKKIVQGLINKERWNETDAVAVTLSYIAKELERVPRWQVKAKAKAKREKERLAKEKGIVANGYRERLTRGRAKLQETIDKVLKEKELERAIKKEIFKDDEF